MSGVWYTGQVRRPVIEAQVVNTFTGEVGLELLVEGWVGSQQTEDRAAGTVLRFEAQKARACPQSGRQPGVGGTEGRGGRRRGRCWEGDLMMKACDVAL